MQIRHFLGNIAAFVCIIALYSCRTSQELHIVATGDVHGAWFDSSYVSDTESRTSLMSVAHYVDSLRSAVGRRNVILLDAGDCLQGDNATYYYNFVDSLGTYPLVEMMAYMGYDAAVVGNHDIETGHNIYDKINTQLAAHGIQWLAANALRTDNGEAYFASYKIMRKAGKRVAVVGFTNPNMEAWLSEPLWSGMRFVSLMTCVQQTVNKVRAEENPDIVIVATHSGTGNGNGGQLESQGLDLLNSLTGVDLIVCAHDHQPVVLSKGNMTLINSGSKAAYVAHAVIGDASRYAEIVRLDKRNIDFNMQERFAADFEKVKEFTLQPVGELKMRMRSRDAYKGMSDYINLIHTVQLGVPEAQISFAAPLTYDGIIEPGVVNFNDMLTIYPFENQLFVLKLKGSEIKSYLEYSYDNWIQTNASHILRITNSPNARTGADRWSFVGRSYNFDSAAGLVYTVDVSKAKGQRVQIISLANGLAFNMQAYYGVAMTSYRASGGGNIIPQGAGLSSDEADKRVIAKYPAIRDMVCDFFAANKLVDHESVSNESVIGNWRFIPQDVEKKISEDLSLIF